MRRQQVDYGRIAELERDIYGHVFEHAGAPAPIACRPSNFACSDPEHVRSHRYVIDGYGFNADGSACARCRALHRRRP